MYQNLKEKLETTISEVDFSGVVTIQKNSKIIYESAFGHANRSDEINNTVHTRFGIASGCKVFTAAGIGVLVDEGKLTFETKLKDCLDISFPHFSAEVTIHQLLTHSSGIPDYFDESVMDDFEELWEKRPMYTMRTLEDFLPMFQDQKMLSQPGEKFHYNNAGYIVLGLIIEQISRMRFTDFVEANIFAKAGMMDSGYFSLDSLPKNTAIGYIDDEETGKWKTNMYAIPVVGGADGGAFVTASDMVKFWDALFTNKLLSRDTTKLMLTPHVHSDEDDYYGYGVWIEKDESSIQKHHVMGYDPGVNVHSAVYKDGTQLVILSNKSDGAYSVMCAIEESL
jgi:CubicO group peptidase (beta-lactamase class C family)